MPDEVVNGESRNDESRNDHYFGVCPECGKVEYVNIGRQHWMFCLEHKVKWLIGSNLFSSWRDETEAEWQRNAEVLEGFREIEPHTSAHNFAPGYGPCHCTRCVDSALNALEMRGAN